MLHGVTGDITSLACYGECPGAGPHSGGYDPQDIGTSGATPYVYVQNDYLPDEVSGGYIRAYEVVQGCASYDPEDEEYNGRKIRVETYYYEDSTYLNWNHEVLSTC